MSGATLQPLERLVRLAEEATALAAAPSTPLPQLNQTLHQLAHFLEVRLCARACDTWHCCCSNHTESICSEEPC